MRNKSKKHIWSVSVVMSMAIIGALAAFFVLANNPGATMAHGDVDDHDADCAEMTDAARDAHNASALLEEEEICGTGGTGGTGDTDVPAIPGFAIQHGGEAQQVSVNWDAVTDAHEYIVEYRLCSTEPCSGTFTMVTLAAADTMYLITSLNAGSQYQVQVTARNAAGVVLVQSSSLVSTSRYLLTFTNDGVTPSRGHDQDFMPTTDAGADTTVTATVWVPETSGSDRTDTVTVQFMSMDDTADPLAYYGIDVDDKDEFSTLGLLAVSATGTGHGELTIRPRDNDRRSFDMTFECTLPATRVYVIVYDDEVNVVERGTVTLECPAAAAVVPDDVTITSECYSVTGYMGDDVDEAMDQLRDDIEPHERPAHPTNPEMGQDTIQILEGSADVQITVTSCEAGPVYIRFLDSDGDVFGTDIDECETCEGASGADVVGLDSQQKLELNLGPTDMDAGMALMYDQYNVVTPGSGADKYLVGKPGMYHRGTFRFIAPCDREPFEVEVYEKDGKVLQELENGMLSQTISCVAAEQAEAQPIEVIQGSRADREMIVRWQPIADAVKYTVAVLDTSDPAMYTVPYVAMFDPSATRETTVTGLTSGTRYIYAVYAELQGGTYSPVEFVINAPEF